MQRAWLFERFAITVTRIDFVDPALAGQDDVRERGVRLEVREVRSSLHGSGYASPEVSLAPAICRIDLLESRPYAADRMHWHPTMVAGEPDDRIMEIEMAADPIGWLRTRLLTFDALLERAGAADAPTATPDVLAVRAAADEIADAVARGLETVRNGSWEGVVHDEDGLADLG